MAVCGMGLFSGLKALLSFGGDVSQVAETSPQNWEDAADAIRRGATGGFFPGLSGLHKEVLAAQLTLYAEQPARFVDATWTLFGPGADFDRLKRLSRFVHGLLVNRRMMCDPLFRQDLARWPAAEVVGRGRRPVPERVRARWISSGGKMVGTRLVAAWNDPIWQRLSVIEHPYPPFDPETDSDWTWVLSREAESLGIIQRGSTLAQPELKPCSQAEIEARLRQYFADSPNV